MSLNSKNDLANTIVTKIVIKTTLLCNRLGSGWFETYLLQNLN